MIPMVTAWISESSPRPVDVLMRPIALVEGLL
jgi:hypothetical protein